MLPYGQEFISLEMLIWLLPIIFIIHDGEEIATMEKWLRGNQDPLQSSAMAKLIHWEKRITFQFSVAVLFIGVFLCLLTFLTAQDFKSGSSLNIWFVGIVGVVLLDGIKHVLFSVKLRKYTPGVIMAALLEIPYGFFALYRFYNAGMTDVKSIVIGLAAMLPLVLILVAAGLLLGRLTAPYHK